MTNINVWPLARNSNFTVFHPGQNIYIETTQWRWKESTRAKWDKRIGEKMEWAIRVKLTINPVSHLTETVDSVSRSHFVALVLLPFFLSGCFGRSGPKTDENDFHFTVIQINVKCVLFYVNSFSVVSVLSPYLSCTQARSHFWTISKWICRCAFWMFMCDAFAISNEYVKMKIGSNFRLFYRTIKPSGFFHYERSLSSLSRSKWSSNGSGR